MMAQVYLFFYKVGFKMEDRHRERIKQNKNKLIELIDFDNLYPQLSKMSIFTEDMLEDINVRICM